ncbi:MAG: hypothetical protein ACP5IA_01475 [Sediminispirochaetaceae bacterium]
MREDRVPESRLSYLIGVIVNSFALYVIQKVPEWNIVFITGEYEQVRNILATAVIVQIVGGVILIVLRTRVMHCLLHVIFNFVSLYAVYRVLSVFPFDFEGIGIPVLATVLKILLIISLAAALIGLISNMFKLRFALRENRRR